MMMWMGYNWYRYNVVLLSIWKKKKKRKKDQSKRYSFLFIFFNML